MKRLLSLTLTLVTFYSVHGQLSPTDSLGNPMNMSQTIINNQSQNPVSMGLYAQIDYNQPIGNGVRQNGEMDVHRLVTFLGYRFNSRTHFVSEIELEHVQEVYVEQAFLNYAIKPQFNIRAGLMLIPMGIINEYHEPTTFHGVERPNLDSKIVPTTWREMGAGIFGRWDNLSIRYQAYVVNGFMGYDGDARLRGSDGFRKGRQKGAESTISTPNFSAKVEHYGINGLKLGASLYTGRTQSTLYDGLNNSENNMVLQADSSTVGLSMVGLDYRYSLRGFMTRGQLIYSSIRDSQRYNSFTGSDLGSAMFGYYVEVGYDLLSLAKKNPDGKKLTPFIRYEKYDTQFRMEGDVAKNEAFDRTDITAGISFHVSPGAAFKADYQYFMNEDENSEDQQQLNFGIGVWF